MDRITWKDRWQYALDTLFSRGTAAMIASLGVLTLVIILFAAAVLSLGQISQADGHPLTFGEAAWESLMRTLDAGTMGGDTGWGFRLVMIGVTLGGVFVLSTLIGILSSGIESKLDELRKGRSLVLETGHTVILGWSEQIFTILPELITANANLRRSCIVILGNMDKVEMEDQIAEKIGSSRTRIVCRRGSPVEMADLRIVNLNAARSIIVLSPESEDPDAEVIKTVLALTSLPEHGSRSCHIVAELREPKNMEIAQVVGRGEVEWVQVGDIVARVIAQTCRQSGLSVVYNELLDFGGDEIYFFQLPTLTGLTYGEALNRFEKNAVLGIHPTGGAPRLNPPMSTIIGAQDRLVVIAADDDRIFVDGQVPAPIETGCISEGQPHPAQPERTLILGWNWRGPSILAELDCYVAPGSETLVVADLDDIEETAAAYSTGLANQHVEVRRGDTTSRSTLDALALARYDHVIILCYSDTLDAQRADSRTLITLLHLRDIAEKSGRSFSIVSEMLDVRNRNLADVTRADDFIVSDRLISLMISQVSENRALNAVFADLFNPDGAEIYLKPAADYVVVGSPVNFYTVVESARRRGETAIGYRIAARARDAAASYGVVLNPAKSANLCFSPLDRVIVLSES